MFFQCACTEPSSALICWHLLYVQYSILKLQQRQVSIFSIVTEKPKSHPVCAFTGPGAGCDGHPHCGGKELHFFHRYELKFPRIVYYEYTEEEISLLHRWEDLFCPHGNLSNSRYPASLLHMSVSNRVKWNLKKIFAVTFPFHYP